MTTPWDQQPDEPAAAYARFLAYRNLGPGRSVEAAYQAYTGRKTAGKSRKSQAVSGTWTADCAGNNWVARAQAWDLHQMAAQGQLAVVGFVHGLEAYTHKVLEALRLTKGPTTWDEITEALHVLSNVIPAATIAALHAHTRNDPADLVNSQSSGGPRLLEDGPGSGDALPPGPLAAGDPDGAGAGPP
jgi:hypothetical protein